MFRHLVTVRVIGGFYRVVLREDTAAQFLRTLATPAPHTEGEPLLSGEVAEFPGLVIHTQPATCEEPRDITPAWRKLPRSRWGR